MLKFLAVFSLISMFLTGCSTIDKMNYLVNQSTCSIYENREAVERSTYIIRENAQLVNESTQAIIENHRLLEEATN